MTLTQARALLPALTASHINDEAEARELHSLAGCTLQLSPRVFLAPPQTLLADLTGCDRALGGEEAALKLAREIFARQGYSAHCALCDNATAAFALALDGGRAAPILDGATCQTLTHVPIERLRLDERSLANLHALGVSTAGALMSLPPATLPSRFGEELVLRVRQLRGEAAEHFTPFNLPEVIRERLEFEGPTDRHDAMMFALRHIATRLADRLEALGIGAARLEATLLATDGKPLAFDLDVSAPTRDPRSLATLLLARFETLDTQERWFDGVEVSVPSRLAVNARQKDLFGVAKEVFSPGLRGLVDELVGKLGVNAVARPVLQPDPRPDRAVAYVPFLERANAGAAAPHGAPAVLWPPQAADVDEHDGQPVTWHEGPRRHELTVVRGPQRVEFGWWEGGQARDYFEIEDDSGARLFMFKEGPNWFSCGAY